MASTIVARKAGEGMPIWMMGGLYEVKATGEETGGALTVMEMTIPAGIGPPPHTHPGGEAVYVIEGTINYHIAGETVEGGPGSFFYIPEGTLENFEPVTDTRLLVIYTPGGIDKFFVEAGEHAPTHAVPPPPSEPPDLARLITTAARYGMEIQAP